MPQRAPASATHPRPFLKWAGGKSRLLPELCCRLPSSFRVYHEPFIGGGALFFTLATADQPQRAYLSDINQPLVEAYQGLKRDVEGVIARLKKHKNDAEHYYRVRSTDPRRLSLAGRAARLIYLNRTCYNGLYRENRRGEFNVPFGRYRNPLLCNEPNLRAVSRALQGASVERRHFSTVVEKAGAGDLVYFDPPYHPLSATSSFTGYDRNGFDADDQKALRDVVALLDDKGVNVMLSNSDTAFIRDLYSDYTIERVLVSRPINSKAERRGKVPEVIVRNYR